MAKTKAQIIAEAQVVKNATEVGENTATRVGGVLEDLADADSVVIIPVTGTSSGGNITLSSNPFTQVQTAMNAGQHAIVRVTIGNDVVDFSMNTYSDSASTYIGVSKFLQQEFQMACTASGTVINQINTSNTFSTGESVPNVGIDAVPTQGSDNLVKSGGVAKKISQLGQKVTNIDLENGYYKSNDNIILPAKTASNSYVCALVKTYEGMKYYVSGQGASSARLWFTADKNRRIVRFAESNLSAIDPIEITIAEGECYIGFNSNIAVSYKKFEVSPALQTIVGASRDAEDELSQQADGLDGQISNLKKDVDLASIIFSGTLTNQYYNLLNIAVGGTYTPTTVYASGYTGIILNVNVGEYYTLNTNGNSSSAKCYAILDDDGVVLAFSQNAVSNLRLRMPENAAKLIVNTKVVAGQNFVTKPFGGLTPISDFESIEQVSIPYMGDGVYFLLSGITIGEVFDKSVLKSANGYCYRVIKVFAGEKYHIKTGGNTAAAKSYAILDNNYIVIDFKQSAGEVDITIENDGFLIVNSTIASYSLVINNWQSRIINKLRDYVFQDVVRASIFDISRFNNDFRFDKVETDDLYAGTLRLGYERQLPLEGSAINVDADLSYGLDGTTALENVRKRIVPYLYWNQQKVGTIVLYDDNGNPYIYDKNGIKKMIVTE